MRRLSLLPTVLLCLIVSPAWATFPTVAGSNTFNETANVTTYTVNLPASISAGDLLIVIFGMDNNNNQTPSWPADWVQMCTSENGTEMFLEARYRIATGSEGASISVTTGTAERAAGFSYRITGWHGTTVPEASCTSSAAGGAEGAPDPPSLNPANWDAEDTLWIAVGNVDDGKTVSAYPTDYDDGQAFLDTTGSGGGVTIAVARRSVNAASQNPGAFTMSVGGSQGMTSATVGIRPAASSTRRPMAPIFLGE